MLLFLYIILISKKCSIALSLEVRVKILLPYKISLLQIYVVSKFSKDMALRTLLHGRPCLLQALYFDAYRTARALRFLAQKYILIWNRK